MKTNHTNEQLQAAIDGACNKINEEHKDVGGLLILDPEDNRWRNEAPARLDLIKVALAALPEPEPPTVDGKTPEDVMQSVYYSTPADEYPFRKAASAVLAAFGKQSQAAEEANARAEKAEAELARIIEAAHEAGWNGVENPKDLAQFIKYLAEEVGNRQAALLAACTSVDEQEVLSRSQLRPLAEAGEVPEGCVRVTGRKSRHTRDGWLLENCSSSADTVFADIQLPATKAKCLFCEGSGFEEEDHGHYPCRSGCKPSVKAAHADKPTPEPMSTKPISLPEWTPKVGDVVMLKSGGPKMTIRAFDRDDPMEAWCHWFKEEKSCAETFPTACLQPA